MKDFKVMKSCAMLDMEYMQITLSKKEEWKVLVIIPCIAQRCKNMKSQPMIL